MSTKEPFDWVGFLVQFFFGAVFGAVIGLGAWTKASNASSMTLDAGLHFMGIGALFVGMLAGLFGDRLWKTISENYRFW